MYTCVCHAVTHAEVTEHVVAGARTEDDVADACGAGSGCGSCLDRICAIISMVHPEHGREPLRRVG